MLEFTGFIFLAVLMLLFRQNIILLLMVLTLYIQMVWGDGALYYLIDDMWVSLNNEVLLAIPIFMVAGNVMSRGSIAQKLINIMTEATKWMPGGLGCSAILSCAIFAAISGSSPVTLLAVGTILYPALLKAGYSRTFSLGALTSGGTLGIIIPPSIPLILYGIATETSIADLFIAGIIPGIILTIALCSYSIFKNWNMPKGKFNLNSFLTAVKDGIWACLMPVILLGGIYSGIYSPTEAAAVALGYAIVVELFIYRELKFMDFYSCAAETARMLGTLFPILAVAMSINSVITILGVPQELASIVTNVVDNKIQFIIAINILLIMVGCFVDVISAILILGPLLLASVQAFGINPVHFGIMMVINLEIGFLTPPLGLNLIVASSAFKESFVTVCKSVLPFILIILVVLLLIAFVPWLSTAFI